MDLPTYTNIWRIEKRLYKLYDLRLPMPLPLVQIGVFLGVFVPWILLLRFAGIPFKSPWHVLYVVPPGVLTWLATRPVIEGKRLTELLLSQSRYLAEPRTWCRLTPIREPREVVVVARVWRRAEAPAPAAAPERAAVKSRRRARKAAAVPTAVPTAAPAAAPAAPAAAPLIPGPAVADAPVPLADYAARQDAPAPAAPVPVVPAVPASAAVASPPLPPAPPAPKPWRRADRDISHEDDVQTEPNPGALERPPATPLLEAPPAPAGNGKRGLASGVRRPGASAEIWPAVPPTTRPDIPQQTPAQPAAPASFGHPTAAAQGGEPEAPEKPAAVREPVASSEVPAPARPADTGSTGSAPAEHDAAPAETAVAAQPAAESAEHGVTAPPNADADDAAEDVHDGERAAESTSTAVPASPTDTSTSGSASPGEDPEDARPAEIAQAESDAGAPAPTGRGEDAEAPEDAPGREPVPSAERGESAQQHADEVSADERAGAESKAAAAAPEGVSPADAPDRESGATAGGAASVERPQVVSPWPAAAQPDTARGRPAAARGRRGVEPFGGEPGDKKVAGWRTAPSRRAPAAPPMRRPAAQGETRPDIPRQMPQRGTGAPAQQQPSQPPVQQRPPQPRPAQQPVRQEPAQPPAARQPVVRPPAPTRPDIPMQTPPTAPAAPAAEAAPAAPAAPALPAEPAAPAASAAPAAQGHPAEPTAPAAAAAPAAPAVPAAPAAPTGFGGRQVGPGEENEWRPAKQERDAGAPRLEPPRPWSKGLSKPMRPAATDGPAWPPVPEPGPAPEAYTDVPPQGVPIPLPPPQPPEPPRPQPVEEEPPPREVRSQPQSPVRPRPLPPPPSPPSSGPAITPPGPEHEVTTGGLRRLIQAVGGGHGEVDAEYEQRLQQPFHGTRHVVVLGCTGGAGQTVTSLMLGHTFAQHNGEPVVAVDVNPGPGALARRTRSETNETLTSLITRADQVGSLTAMRRYTSQAKSGLDVIAAGKNPLQALDDRDYALAIRTIDKFYSVTLLDTAAAVVARVLPYADQIVLVAPASADAPRAVAMTFEWLDGHGYEELRSRAVTVINGVSRRSMDDVEQAEAVARGRCRALVRIPWDDHLSMDRAPRNELKSLRAPTRRAYLALAGVVAGGFTVVPERYQELQQEQEATR